MLLIEALNDPDANVRYHSIEALGRLQVVEAVEPLIALAESGDFFLAFPALDALATIGDQTVAARIVPLLDDEMLCRPAASALGQLGNDEVGPPLAALLNKQNAPVEMICSALATLYDRYEEMFGEGGHIADLAADHIGPTGAHNLLRAFENPQSEDVDVRALALVLGWLEEDPAVDIALTRLLPRPAARPEVVKALVRHGRRVTDLLVARLADNDIEIRQAAVVALGRIGDPRAVPALLNVLQNDPDLIVIAAGALGRIGERSALDHLLALLGHPSASVR